MKKDNKLFKEEYQEKVEEDKKKTNIFMFVFLVALYKKIESVIIWSTIILNSLILVVMFTDINVGIVLFIFNQYIVVSYYLKKRREKLSRVKNELRK